MKTKVDMSKRGVTHRLDQMEGLWLLSKALVNSRVVEKRAGGENRALVMRVEIREILTSHWNHSLGQDVERDRAYDRCIGPILRILVGSRSRAELIQCLKMTAKQELSLEAGTDKQLEPVAARLLKVDVMLS